jgi:2-polyprenyl-3-methyl-5-hydroxy-6-metoxy-1,4-benzoquinol methylase
VSATPSGASVPDYGWKSAAAAHSNDYLQPNILKLVSEATTGIVKPRVFDAGCGNGVLLAALRDAGYSVAGCDMSDSGLVHARSSLPSDVRVEKLSVCDDMRALFGSEWDVVVSTEVIEHLYDPRLFLQRAVELLRPEGTLVLSTPYHGYLKNLALSISGKWDAHLAPLWDGGHIKFWSYRSLGQLLEEFGFTDIRFAGAGRVPYLWKSMIITGRTPSSPRNLKSSPQ